MFRILRHIAFCVLAVSVLIPTAYGVSYGSASIALEKDVIIDLPEIGIVNLPDQVTFRIYDSNTAATPIASQSFLRGEYSAYYNIAKSDGLIQKSYVKFMVDFTNFTNAYSGTSSLWVGIELNGTPTGEREQLDKDTTNKILTAINAQNSGGSGASNSQDANQGSSSESAGSSSQSAGSSSQSASGSQKGADGSSQKDSSYIVYRQVAGSDGQIQYNNGGVQAGAAQFYYDDVSNNVGIGTSAPGLALNITKTSDATLRLASTSGGGYWDIISSNANQYGSSLPAGSFGIGYANTGALRFVIDSSGNIGIGTSAPGLSLNITKTSDATLRLASITGGGYWDIISSNASQYPSISAGSFGIAYANNGTLRFVIDSSGNVGIGSISPCADCKLAVNGKIRAKSVVVDSGWSDFVFEDKYKLMPLQEVEKFIKDNRHLPGIPTEADVKENGVSVGDISAKLLQKVEELTLYMIELKKENETLRNDIALLQKQIVSGKENH